MFHDCAPICSIACGCVLKCLAVFSCVWLRLISRGSLSLFFMWRCEKGWKRTKYRFSLNNRKLWKEEERQMVPMILMATVEMSFMVVVIVMGIAVIE